MTAHPQADSRGVPEGYGPPTGFWPRSRRWLRWVIAAVAVGLAAGVLWAAISPGQAAPAEVKLEADSTPGANPFMPPVGQDQPNVKPPAQAAGSFPGDTPGLYGEGGDKPSCDRQTLVANLLADPTKANAWAAALGIAVQDIPGFADGLNPVVLRTDTAVTVLGYQDDTYVPYPAVLQAGTAVFVNSFGEPTVKCYSGNPLTRPTDFAQASYVGQSWGNFSPTTVIYIQPTQVVVHQYVIVNVYTGASRHYDSWCYDHPGSKYCDRPNPNRWCDSHHGWKGCDGSDEHGDQGGSEHDGHRNDRDHSGDIQRDHGDNHPGGRDSGGKDNGGKDNLAPLYSPGPGKETGGPSQPGESGGKKGGATGSTGSTGSSTVTSGSSTGSTTSQTRSSGTSGVSTGPTGTTTSKTGSPGTSGSPGSSAAATGHLSGTPSKAPPTGLTSLPGLPSLPSLPRGTTGYIQQNQGTQGGNGNQGNESGGHGGQGGRH